MHGDPNDVRPGSCVIGNPGRIPDHRHPVLVLRSQFRVVAPGEWSVESPPVGVQCIELVTQQDPVSRADVVSLDLEIDVDPARRADTDCPEGSQTRLGCPADPGSQAPAKGRAPGRPRRRAPPDGTGHSSKRRAARGREGQPPAAARLRTTGIFPSRRIASSSRAPGARVCPHGTPGAAEEPVRRHTLRSAGGRGLAATAQILQNETGSSAVSETVQGRRTEMPNKQAEPAANSSRRTFLQSAAATAGAGTLLRGQGDQPGNQGRPGRLRRPGHGRGGTGPAGGRLRRAHRGGGHRLPRELEACLEAVGKRHEGKDKVRVDRKGRFLGLDAYQSVIDSDVDVVLLATPPGFRPAHLRACIEAGKHVFWREAHGRR